MAAAALLLALTASASAADVAAGEKRFQVCVACHKVGPDAYNTIGPMLNDIVGKPAASVEGFYYSTPLKEARGAGLVWTPDKLEAFLVNPRQMIPHSSMAFAGLKPADAANVVAYLETLSPDFHAVSAPPPPPTQ